MKTTKLVLGILSIRIFVFVLFQSSAAGMANALAANGEVSGTTSEQSPLCSSSKQNTLRGTPACFWVPAGKQQHLQCFDVPQQHRSLIQGCGAYFYVLVYIYRYFEK